MISHQEIKNLVAEWGLREDIIEKDYVIGWLLWGISAEPELNAGWAFKGGTSLKKCFIETWRFSEDLDFTVLPDGPDKPVTIEPLVKRVLDRVHEESGIDFSIQATVFKYADKYKYTEGKIYYRGPRNSSKAAGIKLDISALEKIVRPTILRTIHHPYNDILPEPIKARCYSFEEVFAEKLRAMGERGRPRDLYDVVLLFRRGDFQTGSKIIKSILEEKCLTKGVSIPTLESIQTAATKGELISEWENMLGHQLLALPPFDEFWEELPQIFNWLNGAAPPARLASIGRGRDEDSIWTPPPAIRQWGVGVPLESIRFAAVNHLCVELGYRKENGQYTQPIIEPYSLRRTKDGHLVLHAVKTQTGETRSYRVDRITNIKVTQKTFQPKYEIEFSATGSIHAQPSTRQTEILPYGHARTASVRKPRRSALSQPKRSFNSSGPKYVFQCGLCMKKFTKSTNNATLRAHKNSFGTPCSGRHGYFVGYK